MSKIQKWKIPLGEQFSGRDIKSLIPEKGDLLLLHSDGYAGQRFLRLSDKSIWVEVYIWENGNKSVTSVKVEGTCYHQGRVSQVSSLQPDDNNICKVLLRHLTPEWQNKIKELGYKILKDNSSRFYIETDDLECCVLKLNKLQIPFGHDKTIMSPAGFMDMLRENGKLNESYLSIYDGRDDFTITIRNDI